MKHKENKENLEIAKIESKINEKFIRNLIAKEHYIKNFEGVSINKKLDVSFFENKFYCHFLMDKFCKVEKNKKHIITGFGPTNAPTAGTLSIILKTILLSYSGIDTTIIISDLGAFNSRNIDIEKIFYLSIRFKKFIKKLGFKGRIRTHCDFDLLKTSAVTSKTLSINDLIENSEITAELYEFLGLQGGDFSTLFDLNLCVADILLPILKNKKRSVLVLAGIEEYFLSKIANLVIERLRKNHKKLVDENEFVASIFAKNINGLNGYPKMSKSIPVSSISVENSEKEIEEKIMNCKNQDEIIILQMITHVSNWDSKKITNAVNSYKKGGSEWIRIKKEYLKLFLGIKKIWDSTEFDSESFEQDILKACIYGK